MKVDVDELNSACGVLNTGIAAAEKVTVDHRYNHSLPPYLCDLAVS